MKNEYLPELLEIKYNNSISGVKSIKLINHNNNLILNINNSNPEIISLKNINKEKWIEFWDNLEKIGLWDLEEEYQSCSLEGGYNWRINIQYKNREINSYGVNIEPKIIIENEVHSVLEELYNSLEELIYSD